MKTTGTIKKIKPVHRDARGLIFDLLEGVNIRHVGYITSKKGAVRGNHYHKRATQYTYILKGRIKWLRKDLRRKNASITSHILKSGDLAVDVPRVAHAMIALENSELLDLTNVSREGSGYRSDTFRIWLTRPSSRKR